MAAEEGIEIVLSPVQLAAVLEGGTITEQETASNRLWGGLQVVGGAIELVGAAALLLAPEPTMVTKVGGGVLAAHGSDTVATGFRQLWTGRRQTTLTAQAATAAARSLGVDPEAAGVVGTAVDIAVPLGAGFAGLARVLAVRQGAIRLAAHEAAGGHTIARHVGRTEAQLRQRLATQRGIPAASTFRTLAEAERAIAQALRANAPAIQAWALRAQPGARLTVNHAAGRVVGQGVVRATGQLRDMTNLTVVLSKTQSGNKVYFILTAYPKP